MGVASKHLVFVVCHVTFVTAYSVAVTFSVLFLLIAFTNQSVFSASCTVHSCSDLHNMFCVWFRENLSKLREFEKFTDTNDNVRAREVREIHAGVTAEVERQNKMANRTMMTCESKMADLQVEIERVSATSVQTCWSNNQLISISL